MLLPTKWVGKRTVEKVVIYDNTRTVTKVY